MRAIAADPTQPGVVYVSDSFVIQDFTGNVLDDGDIIFARSEDYGLTWQRMFQVGTTPDGNVLNDDNDGLRASSRPDDVAGSQVLPALATDAQGNLAAIWYDTRRDPNDHLLDVFGTVSSDAGLTLSPNFRVTDQSFDADAGVYTDPNGRPSYYMGDLIGLALADGTAYAVWTDTRNGNQDIFFSSYSISPVPASLNDRFEPNNSAAEASDLGRVISRDLFKLATVPGDEDWFRLKAAATGNLTVMATPALPGDSVRVELRDASGANVLATGTAVLDTNGQVVGQSIVFPGQAGQTYLLRLLPGPDAAADGPTRYALSVESLTANLGAQAHGVQAGSLAAGGEAYYALTVPATGSLQVTLTPGTTASGNFRLEILD